MDWLILAILSYLSYAISTSIDKHIMNGKSDATRTNAWKMLFDGTFILILGVLFFDVNFGTPVIFWGAIVGLIYAASGVTYFRALGTTNVNVVTPIIQSSILLVFVFSIILLAETVDLIDTIAVILLFLGAYVVLSNKNLEIPKIDSNLILLFCMVFFASFWAIITKMALDFTKAVELAITMYYFSSLFTFIYSVFDKRNLKVELPKIAISAVFGSTGTLLLYLALAMENASKVYPISGLQSVFLFLIAAIFLKEKFNWNTIIGTIMVILGIYLIA